MEVIIIHCLESSRAKYCQYHISLINHFHPLRLNSKIVNNKSPSALIWAFNPSSSTGKDTIYKEVYVSPSLTNKEWYSCIGAHKTSLVPYFIVPKSECRNGWFVRCLNGCHACYCVVCCARTGSCVRCTWWHCWPTQPMLLEIWIPTISQIKVSSYRVSA